MIAPVIAPFFQGRTAGSDDLIIPRELEVLTLPTGDTVRGARAKKKSTCKGADLTAGVKVAYSPSQGFYVEHVQGLRDAPAKVGPR
jgi:hypothetical protein